LDEISRLRIYRLDKAQGHSRTLETDIVHMTNGRQMSDFSTTSFHGQKAESLSGQCLTAASQVQCDIRSSTHLRVGVTNRRHRSKSCWEADSRPTILGPRKEVPSTADMTFLEASPSGLCKPAHDVVIATNIPCEQYG
jgi:hypothetical protein